MSTTTKERLEPVIERLEHYATNVKWTNVQAAQDMLIAVDAMRIALASLEAEKSILYRERNPYNGLTTGWQELTEDEYEFIKDNAGENAEFRTVYTAPPAPVSVMDEAQSRELFEKYRMANIERNKWHPDLYAHLPAREQWAAWEACRNAIMFNNTGNLGVALVLLIFSHPPFMVDGQTPYLGEAMVVQILIFIVQSVLLNTLGLYQAGRGRLSASDTLRVIFRMPIIYVVVIAFAVHSTGWNVQDFFFWPVMEMAGSAMLPIAMVAIGIQLSHTKIHWLDREVWIASFIKLIVFPLLGLVTIYAWNAAVPGTFSPVAAIVFLIYCAVPTAVNTAMYGIEFNNYPEYATQVVMNTTMLSAVTMTFFIFLGHLLFL